MNYALPDFVKNHIHASKYLDWKMEDWAALREECLQATIYNVKEYRLAQYNFRQMIVVAERIWGINHPNTAMMRAFKIPRPPKLAREW